MQFLIDFIFIDISSSRAFDAKQSTPNWLRLSGSAQANTRIIMRYDRKNWFRNEGEKKKRKKKNKP